MAPKWAIGRMGYGTSGPLADLRRTYPQVRASGPVLRVGSGDGRSKELVDARRNELRIRERWKCNGTRGDVQALQIDCGRCLNAMALTRVRVAAIMASGGSMVVGILFATTRRVRGIARRIVHRAVGAGRSSSDNLRVGVPVEVHGYLRGRMRHP
jgi:hypothetical protein